MKIFRMIGKVHYDLVANNAKYREALSPADFNWDEEQINKFKQYLKNLEDMSEDKNKGKDD